MGIDCVVWFVYLNWLFVVRSRPVRTYDSGTAVQRLRARLCGVSGVGRLLACPDARILEYVDNDIVCHDAMDQGFLHLCRILAPG